MWIFHSTPACYQQREPRLKDPRRSDAAGGWETFDSVGGASSPSGGQLRLISSTLSRAALLSQTRRRRRRRRRRPREIRLHRVGRERPCPLVQVAAAAAAVIFICSRFSFFFLSLCPSFSRRLSNPSSLFLSDAEAAMRGADSAPVGEIREVQRSPEAIGLCVGVRGRRLEVEVDENTNM